MFDIGSIFGSIAKAVLPSVSDGDFNPAPHGAAAGEIDGSTGAENASAHADVTTNSAGAGSLTTYVPPGGLHPTADWGKSFQQNTRDATREAIQGALASLAKSI